MKLTKEAREYFKKEGRKGGKKIATKYGTNHFKELAKKRWDERKKASQDLSTAEALTDATPSHIITTEVDNSPLTP